MPATSTTTTQPTNLPLTNPQDNVDFKTNQYFSNYFKTDPKFSQNEYELVKSFFYEQTQNEDATAALTAAVLQTASDTGTFVADVIQKFKKSSTLAEDIPAFLNLSRRGTSLLGHIRGLSPSANTQRQIRI